MNIFNNRLSQYYLCALAAALLVAQGVAAKTYNLEPRQRIFGTPQVIAAETGDNFLELAKEFEVGYEELLAANPTVDPWVPEEGSLILIPTQFILPQGPREGIYINLAEYRLYFFPTSKTVSTYPISIGRGDWKTPREKTEITQKLVKPTWYPPAQIRKESEANGTELPRFIPPGKDNPFGDFALQLGLPGYFIHGTNKPYGVGMRVTHGCIRLRPDDIKALFPLVARKTPATIFYKPFKAAEQDQVVYFESHATEAAKDLKNKETAMQLSKTVAEIYNNKEGLENPPIDWHLVVKIATTGSGVVLPVTVGVSAKLPTPLPRKKKKNLPKQEGHIF